MSSSLFYLAGLSAVSSVYIIPSVPLKNAAIPGLTMPITGLGTGGYGHNISVGYNGYPECWSDSAGCGPWVLNATVAYIQMAAAVSSTQVRIDQANTYEDVDNVGLAIATSGVPRENIFLLQKTGSGQANGYDDTMEQFESILQQGNYSYVDALLVHWPTSTAPSREPACQMGTSNYDPRLCRLATWRAYVEIFNSGRALSIGVSNFNATHLQEIKDAGMILPAINQIPFNIYRSSSWAETVNWCLRNGVTVNAYSPYGVPDYHAFPTSTGMATTPLLDPVVTTIAAAHGRQPAEVLSAWLFALGIPFNPRTYSTAVSFFLSFQWSYSAFLLTVLFTLFPQPPPMQHMEMNLKAFDLVLTSQEINLLSSRPQDWCSLDPKFYECAPDQ